LSPLGCGGAALLGALLLGTPAAAEPSVWDIARDPPARARYLALLQAESSLGEAAHYRAGSRPWRYHLRAAMTSLEPHAKGPDPRVPLLLAGVLLELSDAWAREVVELLRPVLKGAIDPALAADGWYKLAQALGMLHRVERERAAWHQALAFEWRAGRRGYILYRLGDAELGLGHLRRATADFRAAISLTQDADTQARAHYGLGVALERQGDMPAALRAVWFAVRLQGPSPEVSILEKPGTFFVPEYELHYYQALEAMARAEHDDRISRADGLREAVSAWHEYLFEAEPAGEPWAANAKRHLAACERALDEAEPPPPDARE